MKCRKARKLLVQFDDGELGARMSEDLLRHLSQCEGCSNELDVLRRSLDAATEADPADRLANVSAGGLPPLSLSEPGLSRLRSIFLGISLLARFHKRLVAGACLLMLTAVVFVVSHQPRGNHRPAIATSIPRNGGQTSDSWSASDALVLIDLLARPCEAASPTVPLYPENDRAAIQAAIELASARAYVTIMDLPEEALSKYMEIVERFPGTEAADTARRELSLIGRKES